MPDDQLTVAQKTLSVTDEVFAKQHLGGWSAATWSKLRSATYEAKDIDSLFAWITISGLACCEVGLAGECAGLRRMFVNRQVRRQGIGTKLFQQAIDIAQMHGKASLAFTVRKDNSAAYQFYLKQGAVIFSDDAEDYWMAVTFQKEQKE